MGGVAVTRGAKGVDLILRGAPMRQSNDLDL